MAYTATTPTVTHLSSFGDHEGALLARGSSRTPRALSARALLEQELDAVLGPCYRIQDDNLRPPKPYGCADWVYPNQMEEAEQEERVWVDNEPSDYDSDATLPVEGE
jgi:hypothetical protein